MGGRGLYRTKRVWCAACSAQGAVSAINNWIYSIFNFIYSFCVFAPQSQPDLCFSCCHSQLNFTLSQAAEIVFPLMWCFVGFFGRQELRPETSHGP